MGFWLVWNNCGDGLWKFARLIYEKCLLSFLERYFPMEAFPSQTVQKLKLDMESKYPDLKQNIGYNGKRLSDSKKLVDYEIRDGAKIEQCIEVVVKSSDGTQCKLMKLTLF